jgi:hypothetical protein
MKPERLHALVHSRVLVCFGTDNYFRNPNWREDVEVAELLNLPRVLVIRRGTVIPEGPVIQWSHVIYYDHDDLDGPEVARKLRAFLGPHNQIDGFPLEPGGAE